MGPNDNSPPSCLLFRRTTTAGAISQHGIAYLPGRYYDDALMLAARHSLEISIGFELRNSSQTAEEVFVPVDRGRLPVDPWAVLSPSPRRLSAVPSLAEDRACRVDSLDGSRFASRA